MASTIRDVNVDRDAPVQLREQVAAEIRRAIADGQAKPGERLPPARDLAEVLGVNTNTVLWALRELRDEGLLEFRRGRGITVAGTPGRGAVVAEAKGSSGLRATTGTRSTSWFRSSRTSPRQRRRRLDARDVEMTWSARHSPRLSTMEVEPGPAAFRLE